MPGKVEEWVAKAEGDFETAACGRKQRCGSRLVRD